MMGILKLPNSNPLVKGHNEVAINDPMMGILKPLQPLRDAGLLKLVAINDPMMGILKPHAMRTWS